MTEKKFWMCEICTQTFEGEHANAHVEIFLNQILKRESGYVDQYYSDIVRLGMCYRCLEGGLQIWKLPKIIHRLHELESGTLIKEEGFVE